jgi:hypothetical protein
LKKRDVEPNQREPDQQQQAEEAIDSSQEKEPLEQARTLDVGTTMQVHKAAGNGEQPAEE